MAKRGKGAKQRKADTRCFVQVGERPSIGVETSTGRPWVGVDQQVGHGSADALFALTDAQYARALVDGLYGDPFLGECWRGEHRDRQLFHPGEPAYPSDGWRPGRWLPRRSRMIPQRFAGELWWHVDALGEADDGERATVSQALAAGTALVETGPDGVSRMTFRLVGDHAYPRPYALVAGLDANSSRQQARDVLGEPVVGIPDVYAVEGDRLRLGYEDGGLAEIALERGPVRPLPDGGVRPYLAVLGDLEGGTAFREVARLAGESHRRWAVSSGVARRLLAYDGGVEVQVENTRVLSVRVPSSSGVALDRRVLGEPADTSGRFDLYRFGDRDLVVEYDGEAGSADATPVEATAVLRGVTVSHGIHRWRSGELVLFLDVLGIEESHPLVAQVRDLAGVQLRMRSGRVSEVTIGSRGHRAERFAAFIDGMPAEPTRKDLPIGVPQLTGKHDDLWDFDAAWVHVHARDGSLITTITVSQEQPRGVAVRP